MIKQEIIVVYGDNNKSVTKIIHSIKKYTYKCKSKRWYSFPFPLRLRIYNSLIPIFGWV